MNTNLTAVSQVMFVVSLCSAITTAKYSPNSSDAAGTIADILCKAVDEASETLPKTGRENTTTGVDD